VVYGAIVVAWVAALAYTVRVIVNERREIDDFEEEAPATAQG
jgi:uncharacterized membrane protein